MQLLAPLAPTDDELTRAELLENRRRVLAVLTLLALSPRPLTRDQLADHFWRDSEPARARHSVTESLRMLRRVLGEDAVASRAAHLSLDPDVPLESDVAQFLAAHAAADHATAVSLYTGDFLDGIYVERAPRFDEWVDRQRQSLRDAFVASCAAECGRLAGEGAHAEAAPIARRWLDVAPLSTEAAEAWFRALLAPGSSEAVRTARERFTAYAASLEAEYDTPPDRRLVQLFDDAEQVLASRSAAVPEPVKPRALVEPPTVSELSTADAPVVGAPASSRTTADDRAQSPVAVPRRSRIALAILMLLVVAPVVAWRFGLFGSGRSAIADSDQVASMVVADAENASPDSLLGYMVTLAVTTALREADAVQPLSASRVRELRRLTTSPTDTAALRGPLTEPIARTVAVRAGAGAVAIPVIVTLGDQYRVALRVVRTSDGATVSSAQSAIVAPAGLLSAIDDVVQRTRRQLPDRGRTAAPRALPDYTTASLAALRLYAQGAQAFDRNDPVSALEYYRQSVATDSTFALAWTALGRVLSFANRPMAADSAFAAALRHSAHLTERERMIVRAAAFRARGFADSAIAVRAAWIAAHPDDVEQLRVQLYDLISASRNVEAVALGEALVRRDSTNENVLYNLALAYRADDLPTRRRAAETYARGLRLDPTHRRNPMLPQLFGGLLARAQMYDSAARFLESFGPEDQRVYGRAMRAYGQMELLRNQPRAAIVPFERAISAGQAMHDTLTWVRARLWLANTLAAAGESDRARAHADTLAKEATWLHEPPIQYWIGLHLSRLGRVNDAQSVLKALERSMVATSRVHAADQALLKAEIATALGRATSVLPTLQGAMRGDSTAISLETVAWASLQSGDSATARTLAPAILGARDSFGFEGWLAMERTKAWSARLGTETRR